MKRVECNNFRQFNNHKCDEHVPRYCNSWCACERNSSFRFLKEDTADACRMKHREMKTLMPKNCSFNQEFENMDLEYDRKLEKETRYDCCRIRANLCELPTTYVSNNPQLSNNVDNTRMSKETNDYVDLKSVTYEHSLKFVDFNDQLENLGNMIDKSKNDFLNKTSPNKKEYLRNGKKVDSKNHFKNVYGNCNKICKINQEQINCNQNVFKESCGDFKNSYLMTDFKNSCRESCPLVDFKYHKLSDHRFVCYDTSTYFDTRNEMPNLCSSSEVDYLREKLKMLQRDAYSNYVNFNGNKELTHDNIVPQDDKNSSEIKDIFVSTINIKPKLKKERRILSPPTSRGRHRVLLRTRRVNSAKYSKLKSKPSSVVSNGTFCER